MCVCLYIYICIRPTFLLVTELHAPFPASWPAEGTTTGKVEAAIELPATCFFLKIGLMGKTRDFNRFQRCNGGLMWLYMIIEQ